MPRITMPTQLAPEAKEAKRDYYDRHTPHVEAPATAKKGVPFLVTVKMGVDYPHPDVADHHIQRLQLFDGERLLASAEYEPGAFTGGQEPATGHSRVVFQISLAKKGRLSAMSYCTQHGLWMSDDALVDVED